MRSPNDQEAGDAPFMAELAPDGQHLVRMTAEGRSGVSDEVEDLDDSDLTLDRPLEHDVD
jgi:hypothetical protein